MEKVTTAFVIALIIVVVNGAITIRPNAANDSMPTLTVTPSPRAIFCEGNLYPIMITDCDTDGDVAPPNTPA